MNSRPFTDDFYGGYPREQESIQPFTKSKENPDHHFRDITIRRDHR